MGNKEWIQGRQGHINYPNDCAARKIHSLSAIICSDGHLFMKNAQG